MKKLLTLIAFASMLVFAGCEKKPVEDPFEEPFEATVSLATDGLVMSVGREIAFYYFINSNLNLSQLAIESSDENIVAFEPGMILHAKAPGSAVVSVSYEDLRVEIPVVVENSVLMYVDDVSFITGRGSVAAGKIESGVANVYDAAEIVNPAAGSEVLSTVLTGLTLGKKVVDSVSYKDEDPAMLVRGIEMNEIQVGAAIVTKGTKAAVLTNEFKAVVTSVEEGGSLSPEGDLYLHLGSTMFDAKLTGSLLHGEIVTIKLDGQVAAFPGQTCYDYNAASGNVKARFQILSVTKIAEL